MDSSKITENVRNDTPVVQFYYLLAKIRDKDKNRLLILALRRNTLFALLSTFESLIFVQLGPML